MSNGQKIKQSVPTRGIPLSQFNKADLMMHWRRLKLKDTCLNTGPKSLDRINQACALSYLLSCCYPSLLLTKIMES